MPINHMTPSIEERLTALVAEKETIEQELKKATYTIEEAKKYVTSIQLRINELHLLRKLRDGQFIVIEADTGDPINLSFHKKVA